MVHLWIRAEERADERRVGATPGGVSDLLRAGFRVTVEDSPSRIIPIEAYRQAGATIAAPGSWRSAPAEAIIYGLKELSAEPTPLTHRHILFGHAYKGQPEGRALLDRFRAGGGTLYDLEYLQDEVGRRVAAFGFWAGYVGAALSVAAWAAQQNGDTLDAVSVWTDKDSLIRDLRAMLVPLAPRKPTALIIGALGRTGSGASALLDALGIVPTRWDMAETSHGGPFPEVLDHDIFLNCILATEGVPVFVPATAPISPRRLSVIGDIACDPTSAFSPIKVYDRVTTWAAPTLRVTRTPVLDVTAIDNLPSLLPLESSADFAAQVLPHLLTLPQIDRGVWGRAEAIFQDALAGL